MAEWARSRAGKQENLHWISFEVGDADLWAPMLQVLSKAGLNLGSLARGARKGARARTTSWNRAQLVSLAAAVVGSPQPLTVVLDGFEPAQLIVFVIAVVLVFGGLLASRRRR